jgi:hypothetical protein
MESSPGQSQGAPETEANMVPDRGCARMHAHAVVEATAETRHRLHHGCVQAPSVSLRLAKDGQAFSGVGMDCEPAQSAASVRRDRGRFLFACVAFVASLTERAVLSRVRIAHPSSGCHRAAHDGA